MLLFNSIVFFAMGVNAQDFGSYAFGIETSMAKGKGFNNLGVGLTIQRVDVFGLEFLRMNFSGLFYPRQKDVRFFTGTAGFDYLFPIGEKLAIYPSAKLAYQITNIKGADPGLKGLEEYVDNTDLEEGALGCSLGGGIEYYFRPEYKIFGEVRYNTFSYDAIKPNHLSVLLGIAYVW